MDKQQIEQIRAELGLAKCPECEGSLVPGKIGVGGFSYLPPRWIKCVRCKGRGVIELKGGRK